MRTRTCVFPHKGRHGDLFRRNPLKWMWSREQQHAKSKRVWPQSRRTLYKPNHPQGEDILYVIHGRMGPWKPHHPFPDRGAALHHPNSIQILKKSCSRFLFLSLQQKETVKETRQGTKHVVAMWTLSTLENVGTGSVYSMRT